MVYMLAVTVINKTIDPLMAHLNKRGVISMYWVINDDDEVSMALKTKVAGIMTDRPEFVKT